MRLSPLLFLAMAGCASSSGVIGTERPDTFKVSATAITSFGGEATAKSNAYRKAAEKCAGLGKKVQLIDEQAGAQFTGASVAVTFRCGS